MNKQKTRNAALALIGLMALGIYILACTSSPSFSPDDTKVLYPAIDPGSGLIGMSVYDREARRSEMLYMLAGYEDKTETQAKASPGLLRGQWLSNGQEVVIAYLGPGGGGKEEGTVTLSVMPWATGRPIKTLVAACKSAGVFIMSPLCVAGDRLFYCPEEDQVVRIDLHTCDQVKHRFEDVTGKLALFPTSDNRGVFYAEQKDGSDGKTVFGRLNPEDFRRTPLLVVTNRLYDETVGAMEDDKLWTVVAYDQPGKLLACLKGSKGKAELVVWRDSKVAFSRSVDMHTESLVFGNAALAATSKAVWATYAKEVGTNGSSFGLMEIPFSEERPREVTLIERAPKEMEGGAGYFQAAFSHDGKTAAMASTYLALLGDEGKRIRPEDCALFFVDLTDPKLKVTKVPIPMPEPRRSGEK
jgi:hypothetical protein